MNTSQKSKISRRTFALATGTVVVGAKASSAAETKVITQASVPGDPAAPAEQKGTVPESGAFDGSLAFVRREVACKAQPFPLKDVRLSPSLFYPAQEANRALLHRYPADRLLHTFRINAGLESSAEPLGGWERPDCELRGHFVGHYLSACALMYASTGDEQVRTKGSSMVSELAKCQERLGGGYLSAFPVELFDRLRARKQVWAPFYTYHKILSGMLDMYELAGCEQALAVAKGMAHWTDAWTSALPEDDMQMVLDTEYGGMNDALYRLAALTNDNRYGTIGDRFTKKRFFNPLAGYRDQLRGLHTNTHIPQVIGAARRYELTGDPRFHDVADAFWTEVVETRSYVTGGTSNNEGWLVPPNHLHEELQKGTATNECCCAYNMMKLTRQLYTWTADPHYFDYYERVLYNHRLGTIDTSNGHTQYYLGVVPSSWRTFGTETNSFWCCNGTGVEEYSKLADSIYFHDRDGLYVNLFIPSELNWKTRGIRVRQTSDLGQKAAASLHIETSSPQRFTVRIRIPDWVASFPEIRINGKATEVSASPGSYAVIAREWRTGDRVDISLPMTLRSEAFSDAPGVQAFVYGPFVLAGYLDDGSVPENLVVGPMGPELAKVQSVSSDVFALPPGDAKALLRPGDAPLSFVVDDGSRRIPFVTFHQVPPGRRYSLYWRVQSS